MVLEVVIQSTTTTTTTTTVCSFQSGRKASGIALRVECSSAFNREKVHFISKRWRRRRRASLLHSYPSFSLFFLSLSLSQSSMENGETSARAAGASAGAGAAVYFSICLFDPVFHLELLLYWRTRLFHQIITACYQVLRLTSNLF